MASELLEKVDTDMTRRIPTIDVIEGRKWVLVVYSCGIPAQWTL